MARLLLEGPLWMLVAGGERGPYAKVGTFSMRALPKRRYQGLPELGPAEPLRSA